MPLDAGLCGFLAFVLISLAACSPQRAPAVLDASGVADIATAELPDAAVAVADVVDALGVVDAVDEADTLDVVLPDVTVTDASVGDIVLDELTDAEPQDITPDGDTKDAGPAETTATDLGYTVPDFGPCAYKDIVVYADSLPDDSTCTGGCPADHPCTCGDCPWVQTAPMLLPRAGATAVWTGTEIVVLGGTGQGTIPWTAERWNPKGNLGFQQVNTPPIVTSIQKPVGHWDGKYLSVIFSHRLYPKKDDFSFRWDPVTDTSTKLAMTDRMYSYSDEALGRYLVWVGGKVFDWGRIPKGQYYGLAFELYDPEQDSWAPLPDPGAFIDENDIPVNPCTLVSGDDVFLFDVAYPPAAGSGLDPNKSITLRYNLPSKAWSAISQAMPFDFGHDGCSSNVIAEGVDDGFIVWGSKGEPPPTELDPPHGVRYVKATDSWIPFASPSNFAWPGALGRPVQSGSRFYFSGLRFTSNLSIPSTHPNNLTIFDSTSDSWSYTTPVGFPNDGRGGMAMVVANGELYVLGGTDGPPSVVVWHQDGVRLALPFSGGNP